MAKISAITNDYYSSEMQKDARTSGKYTEIMASLTKCPFCDLKTKYFVKEGVDVALTVNLFPYIDGHLLVIPKRHVEKLDDLTASEFTEIGEMLKLGKARLREILGISSVNVLYREGVKSGSSLGHLHFHIIPMEPPVFVPKNYELTYAPIEVAEKLRNENLAYMREACWRCDTSDCQVKTGCLAVRAGKVILGSCNMTKNVKTPETPKTMKADREAVTHAEEALISTARKTNTSLVGATLYLTRFPCEKCAKLLVGAGFTAIYYMSDLFTLGNVALPYLEKHGVQVVQIKEPDVWKGYKC